MRRSHFIMMLVVLGLAGARPGIDAPCTAQDSNTKADDILSRAPPLWTEFRRRRFDRSAYSVKWQTSFKNKANDQWETRKGESMRYSSGDTKMSRTRNDPDSDASHENELAIAVNPTYAFQLERTSDRSWRIVDVKPISAVQPWTVKDLELKHRVSNPVDVAIRMAFVSDPRLEIDSKPIELFLKDNKRLVDSIENHTDPQLGTIVTLKLLLDEEASSGRKSRDGAARTIVNGFIDFLADYNWLMLKYEINTKLVASDGSVVSTVQRTMTSEYDGVESGFGTPKSITIEYLSSRGASHKDAYEYRQLTPHELSEAASQCYLKGYDLPEPTIGQKRWPRWLFLVLAIAGFSIVILGIKWWNASCK